MTVEPAAEEESGWTQVKNTPKRNNGNRKWYECVHPLQRTEKWRAEFVVNRSDQGKQWLIDVAMTQLLTPFFESDNNTAIICKDKTEIRNLEQLDKELNRKLQNVVQTTETKDRKIVVFEIMYPNGLHNAKRDKVMMQHLKDNKVFLNEHKTTEMIFEQVGFFIELDPATVYRPDLTETLQQTLEQHIKDHPQDMKDPFSPTATDQKVPYFEIRKGIEAQFLRSETEPRTKTTIKTEVIQVWTEISSAETLRKLLTKADLYYSYVGQFIPKKRGVKLYTTEKYINAIKKQLTYKSEISSIMIQYLAEEVMSEDINEFMLDGTMNSLDNHLLAMEHVLRIEPTNELATKGKWLIICKKKYREEVRAELISNLHEYYKRSVIYESVATKFYTPIPIVAPPRYDYSEYVESIIPESMSQCEETKHDLELMRRRSSTNRNKRGPPLSTITTTSSREAFNDNSPYLTALTSSPRPKQQNNTINTNKNSNQLTSSDSINNNSSLSRDTTLSILTSKVDNLALQLASAQGEIKESRKIIAALIEENKEMKERHLRTEEIHNKTQQMFQQFMTAFNPQMFQQVNQPFVPIDTGTPTERTSYNSNDATYGTMNEISSTPANTTNPSDQHFFSATTSLSSLTPTPKEPPDIRPRTLVYDHVNSATGYETIAHPPPSYDEMEDQLNLNHHSTSTSQRMLEDVEK